MKLNGQTPSHAGPSLLGLAIVYTLLVGASVISALLLKHGALVVNPYSSAEEARRFFADNPVALRLAAFFSFGSSVPLGICYTKIPKSKRIGFTHDVSKPLDTDRVSKFEKEVLCPGYLCLL